MGIFGWNNKNYNNNDNNEYEEMLTGMIQYYDDLNGITDCMEYWYESNEEFMKNREQCVYYQNHLNYLSDIQKQLIKEVYDYIVESIEVFNDNMFKEYSALRKNFNSIELMSDERYKNLWNKKINLMDSFHGHVNYTQSVTINLLSLFDDKSSYSDKAYKKLYFKESGLSTEPTKINKECLSAIYLSAIKKGYLETIGYFEKFSETPCPPFENTVRIPNYRLFILNNVVKYYEKKSIKNIESIFYYVYEFQAEKRKVEYDEEFIDKINKYFSTTKTLIGLINKNYKYVSLIKTIEKYNKIIADTKK